MLWKHTYITVFSRDLTSFLDSEILWGPGKQEKKPQITTKACQAYMSSI